MDLKALHKISYGLYVLGAAKGDQLNAQIANTVIQVSSTPPSLSVCINKQNLTHEYIQASRAFTVSVLAQDTPLSYIGQLGFKSGREANKLEGLNYRLGDTGAPLLLDHALAYMEVRVVSETDAGTHTDFIGELVGAGVLSEGEPMTYAYYHQVKGGTTPKTAPSYIQEHEEEVTKMASDKYECSVCGYVYDPEKGDPENNVLPGTPFEQLPEDWVCPVCGVAKSDFERVD